MIGNTNFEKKKIFHLLSQILANVMLVNKGLTVSQIMYVFSVFSLERRFPIPDFPTGYMPLYSGPRRDY